MRILRFFFFHHFPANHGEAFLLPHHAMADEYNFIMDPSGISGDVLLTRSYIDVH